MTAGPHAELPPMDGRGELRFDDDDIEQLLAGGGDDLVPAGLRSLAPLIAAARLRATAGEAAREGEMTGLFRVARRARKVGPRRSFGVKVVAIAGVLTVASATAAAAAGGLPEPVQNTAASLLARVGISVPAGDNGPDSGPDAGNPATTVPAPPSAAAVPVPETDPASPVVADAAAPEEQPAAPAAAPEAAPAAAPEAAPPPPAENEDEQQAAPAPHGTPHSDKATPPGQDKEKPAKPPKPPKGDKPDKPKKP